VPVTDEGLVGLSRRIDALDAARVVGLVGFFAAEGHRAEGFGSKAGWMRARLGLTEPAARALLVRVSRMAAWPVMRALWVDGSLTGAQVETVVRLVPKGLVDLYAEHDAACSEVLVGLSLADTKVAIGEWVRRAEAVTSVDPAGLEARPVVAPSETQWSRTLDDRAEERSNFSPGDATVVENALRVATRVDEPGEVRTAAQRRAEAWVSVARGFLDHHTNPDRRPGRQHPHILVTVDLDDLAAGVLWGAGLTTRQQLDTWCTLNGYGAATRAFLTHGLACGSTAMRTLEGRHLTPQVVNDLFGEGTTLARLLLADGQVLDHGRSIRLATPTLRDAILARDGTCRYPGCDAPAAWADIHHIRAWAEGGTTDIAQLVALCGAHHGLVHRRGHGLTVDDDGTVIFTFPDRAPVCSPPPRRTPPPHLPVHHPTLDALTPDPWTPPDDTSALFADNDTDTTPTDGTEHADRPGRTEHTEGIESTPGADPADLAGILADLTAFLAGEAIGPHDHTSTPAGHESLDDDAVDDLVRQRAARLVRAA